MLGIEAIGTYIPDRKIDNLQRREKFDVDQTFLETKTGMLRLSVRGNDEETSDMCVAAFADLQRKIDISKEDIECLIVCTQNPDGCGLPHTSAALHAKLELPQSCAVFDISLGCSGYVYSLSVIQSFMHANGFRKGLLFTADPYSKIIDDEDKNTSLLFGDAATVTLISDTPRWHTGKFLFGSQGKERASIQVQPENRKFTMNGRSVFTFTATVVPKHIQEMLAMNDMSISDVDVFAFHQASYFIIDTLRKRLGVEKDKVPFVAGDYGNTVSSSIPLALNGLSGDEEKIVIAGFGVGLSWASTVLFKMEEKGV